MGIDQLYRHALNLHRAVKKEGPIQAAIALEDYEGAKPLVREIWQGKRWENLWGMVTIYSLQEARLIPAYVLLGYLRGYFLHREVPENDQALWPHFLGDLGLESQTLPRPKEYDRLWEVLSRHPETRGNLRYHAGGNRDFIGTLDAIFHFRALRLKELKRRFLAYFAGEPEKAPKGYQRLFAQLKRVFETLLESEEIPDLENKDSIRSFLEASGLILRPDPVAFLFYRSEKAFEELYRTLKGEPKPRAPRPRRHPQVRVEFVDTPADMDVEVVPVLNSGLLIEGWRVYGEVRLEDGRFKRFAWRPRLTEAGEPIAEEVKKAFPEGENVHFRLHHKAVGVRFSTREWIMPAPIVISQVPKGSKPRSLRYRLRSKPEPSNNLEELFAQPPEDDSAIADSEFYTDQLIVELQIDGKTDEWRPIGQIPVRIPITPELWVDKEAVWGRSKNIPLRANITIRTGRKKKRILARKKVLLSSKPQKVASLELVPVTIELLYGSRRETINAAPRAWPAGWWRIGLGYLSATERE